jgi:cytoskeleton protein RodZ
LASSVCRILKIDSVPVLDRLPPNSIHRLKYSGSGAGTVFRPLPEITGQSAWKKIPLPVLLSGLALLLGALALVFIPALKQDGALVDVGNLSLSPAVELAISDESVTPLQPTLQAGDSSAIQGVDPEGLPLSGPINAVVSMPDGTLVAAPPSKSASSAALAADSALPVPGVGQVTFRASAQSWVKVTDANGAVVLRRTLAPGDVAEASGELPLAAVVGRADATQVQVHGKAFDLSAVSRDNVARFEVK